MWRRIILWSALSAMAAGVIAAVAFLRDMKSARDRVLGKSAVLPSPFGDIEYAEGGSGPDVLVIHGSGGGFDQGELLARALLGGRFRWIAPSRFGYLRSTFHAGATFEDQARAYAHLLDRLEIGKVAVVAISHGGPSALLFAALHPERVASLTLISAGVAPVPGAGQLQANQKGDRLTTVFRHDALYWGITKFFRKQFMEMMGADDAVIARLTAEQREWVGQTIDGMNPVSWRTAGVVLDNRAVLPGERIAAVRAPTLIFHAKDDTLQLYHNAEFAAARIAGARLVSFAHGGHLLFSVEQPAIGAAVQQHILEHRGE